MIRGPPMVKRVCKDDRDKSLITLSDDDLVKNPGLVAYEDGFADAREQGLDGYILDTSYTPEQRMRYQAGFAKGLRIWRIRSNDPRQANVRFSA